MSLSAQIQTPVLTYTQPLGLFIDGKFVKGVAGKTFDTINPTNEKIIAAVHEADPEGKLISLLSTSYYCQHKSSRCRYCCQSSTQSVQRRLEKNYPLRKRDTVSQACRTL